MELRRPSKLRPPKRRGAFGRMPGSVPQRARRRQNPPRKRSKRSGRPKNLSRRRPKRRAPRRAPVEKAQSQETCCPKECQQGSGNPRRRQGTRRPPTAAARHRSVGSQGNLRCVGASEHGLEGRGTGTPAAPAAARGKCRGAGTHEWSKPRREYRRPGRGQEGGRPTGRQAATQASTRRTQATTLASASNESTDVSVSIAAVTTIVALLLSAIASSDVMASPRTLAVP